MADTVTINSLSNQYINGTEAAAGYTLSGTYDPAQTGANLFVDFQSGNGDVQYQVPAGNMVSGAWSLTLTPSEAAALPDGAYTVTASLYSSTYTPLGATTAQVTVDETAPVIASIAQSASGTWTNVTSDTITVSASDGGTGLASVSIYDGTTSLGAATLTSGAYTYTATGLADGAHTLTAVATDVAGNTSTSTLSAVDKVDHTAPIIGSIAKSAPTTAWTSTTLDTITVTASDAASTVTSVAIYDGTTSLGAATLSSGAWTYTTGSLTDGVHTFTAVATDSAGNTSTSTLSALDHVDKTAPTIGTPTQSQTAAWTTTRADTITVSASDSGSGVASVEIYYDGGSSGAAVLTSGAWTYTATSLTGGAHTFTAVATDNAGNTSTASPGVVDQVDYTAPTISAITQSVTDGPPSTVTSDTITVTAGDLVSTVASVAIWDNGVSIGAATSGGGVWTYTDSALTSGANVFTAVATDAAGNTSTSTASILDQFAHLTPIVGGVTQSVSLTTSGWTNSQSDIITGTASEGAARSGSRSRTTGRPSVT